MTETYLQYLFETRKLGNSFKTTDGNCLEIISFGQHNKSSGPDFLEATLKYDDKIWAGNIEFHLKSSDWLKHGHQNDIAYNNVIAHFVLEHDLDIYSGQFKLPAVELKNQIESTRLNNLKYTAKDWIPCAGFISDVDHSLIEEQMSVAFESRAARKRQQVIDLFKTFSNDQKRVLFVLIAKTLGGQFNSHAMESLISKVDFNTMAHIGHNAERIRTYLAGLSGLHYSDDFAYMQQLYQLHPMSSVSWKTYGMRQGSQPLKRINQLAALLFKSSSFDMHTEMDEWKKFFDLRETKNVPNISKSMVDLLIINVIVPFSLAMAWFKDDQTLQQKAINMLQRISPEQNNILKGWAKYGVKANNSWESQALIELKNEFCNQKKCLFCSIGLKVLKR